MSSSNILRFFSDPQFSKTSPLRQYHKSKKFSSPQSDRDKIRIIYNKTAYDRNAVTILLIKFRTDLNISLFSRISFKDVAVAKALYVCLSNIKKIQYKTQAEQTIRDFLDIKGFFNRWLSQFRTEPTVNADLKLVSQWSRKNQKTSYRLRSTRESAYCSRFDSWRKENNRFQQISEIFHHQGSESSYHQRSLSFSKREPFRPESSREYHRESPPSSLKLDTRLFRSYSSREYHRESPFSSSGDTESFRSDSSREYHRGSPSSSSKLDTESFKSDSSEEYRRASSENEKPRSETKSSCYYRFDSEERDYYRSDQDKSRHRPDQDDDYYRSDRKKRDYYLSDRETFRDVNSAFVSRENRRLLTVSNDSSRARSPWKDLISARSRYSIPANSNDTPQPRSSWKDLIVASSSWKDLILASVARSRYDNDSRYCIRLFYLSENDLSENDCDLFWFSHLRRILIHHDILRKTPILLSHIL